MAYGTAVAISPDGRLLKARRCEFEKEYALTIQAAIKLMCDFLRNNKLFPAVIDKVAPRDASLLKEYLATFPEKPESIFAFPWVSFHTRVAYDPDERFSLDEYTAVAKDLGL